MKDAIIVLSGGMDSVTLLYKEKESIDCAVSFDYGSNHNAREIACAAEHCSMLGIEHLVIPLEFMAKYFHSSLLEGPDLIPEGNYNDQKLKSTVVPFRNGIMLAIACGLAESRGLTRVMIANHSGDHTIYPDCRKGFIDAMDSAMKAGTYENVTIHAPFTCVSKTDIAKLGASLGVDFSKTYSCYKGGAKHCGKCGTCMERKEAFAMAGLVDPTEYDE